MIAIIVAVDKNGIIGKNNDLPWRIPADLAYFKKITLGSTVVMGRKTFESIGKPLPKRNNVILSRNNFKVEGCVTLPSIEELKPFTENLKDNETVFIIGGAKIFEQALPVTDLLYLTYIDEEFDGDTYFPAFDLGEWDLVSDEKGIKDEKNPYDYYFRVYKREKKY